ncbi:MAG: mechanosensitive ion channel domain-containing protein [Thermodesulfobacteriota bacterium]
MIFPAVLGIIMAVMAVVNGWAQDTGPSSGAGRPSPSLAVSITDALDSEAHLVASLAEEKRAADQAEPSFSRQLETYQTQHAVYANMLALYTVPTTDLSAASRHILSSLAEIEDQQDSNRKDLAVVETYRSAIEGQLAANRSYLSEMTAGSKSKAAGTVVSMKKLVTLVTEKQKLLDDLYGIYSSRIDRLNTIHIKLTDLSQQLSLRVQETRKRDFLTRSAEFPLSAGWTGIRQEIQQIREAARLRFSLTYLADEGRALWRSVRPVLAYGALLVLLSIMGVGRLTAWRQDTARSPAFSTCTVFQAALHVFSRSAWLLVFTVLLLVLTHTGGYLVSPLAGLLLSLSMLFLFSRWVLDTVGCAEKSPGRPVAPAPARMIRRACYGVQAFGTLYTLVLFLVPGAGGILFLLRLLFEISAVTWNFVFWKVVNRTAPHADNPKEALRYRYFITGMFYLVTLGALVLELAGHGPIALYWYLSWGKTLVLVVWFFIAHMALGELSRVFRAKAETGSKTPENQNFPVQWVLIKLAQVVLYAGGLIALVVAWGGGRDVLVSLFSALFRSYKIGGLSLSAMGFVYAAAALFLTHVIAGAWRYLFHRNVLRDSGMAPGAQESVITITVYVIWAAGILAALHVVGFNTTSLTVAFGALGVGLGFGLQNIFNNFVSGLILLFERPIQVGDDIEVDGIWATVKKINVRSTIVQTADNASMIIPNADLVSSKVTNWSFQDKRLRRNITVGVAYGSDLELVRKTLLEVAAGNARVLKTPKPDVVFKDFGDSALMFLLRVWTHVSYFYAVETEIRFEIDRLFKEKNISIAFPQMDVHLYNETSRYRPKAE